MKRELLRFKLVIVALTVFVFPILASADVFMKEKDHKDGMTIMGHAQPPQDQTVTTWIAKDKMRKDQGDMSTIARLDNDKVVIFHINHPKKTYMELSMGSDDLQGMASAMGGDIKVKVTPTNETKKIGNWNCRKYLQDMDMGMMPMRSEVWASEDIKIPYQDFYERVSLTMGSQQPGMGAPMGAMQQEMKKIKGIPVLTVSSMTVMKDTVVKSSRELLEVKEDTAPAGIFDIPQGYTKQTLPQGLGDRKKPGKQKAQ
jgi:hypothetical protein